MADIDPIAVAIGATTVAAGSTATMVYQTHRINQIKSQQKRERIELFALEGGLISLAIGTAIDAYLSRKKYKDLLNVDNARYADLACAVTDLENRVNSLNISAIDAKLDMVVAATATPKIVPETNKDEKKEESGA